MRQKKLDSEVFCTYFVCNSTRVPLWRLEMIRRPFELIFIISRDFPKQSFCPGNGVDIDKLQNLRIWGPSYHFIYSVSSSDEIPLPFRLTVYCPVDIYKCNLHRTITSKHRPRNKLFITCCSFISLLQLIEYYLDVCLNKQNIKQQTMGTYTTMGGHKIK